MITNNFDETTFNWSQIPLQAFIGIGDQFSITPRNIAAPVLLRHLLTQGSGHLAEMKESGEVEEDEDDENGIRYLTMMEKMGGRLLHKYIGEGFYQALYIWQHGLVKVEFNADYLNVSAFSQDEGFIADLQKKIRGEFIPPVKKGHIFAIVRYGQNLSLSSVGNASIPLEVGNYTKSVLEDYNFVLKDLRSSNPSGRIVIMEGEPGTGKTHLIRAMLTEVPDAMFVLIDPEMVQSLAGPELLPLLLNNKQSYAKNGPIVLVLEDADRCLVTRGDKNLNSIQSLLNLGDGILGSLLDLRIVATTNAKKLEMEAAILRPGRLSKRLDVSALDLQTAHGVFGRLLPKTEYPKDLTIFGKKDRDIINFKMTLAEVYSQARKAGWDPGQRTAKKERKSNYETDDDMDYDD
jgi:hypothetical protein